MSDRVNILQRVEDMDVSPEFEGYSRVVIWLDVRDDDGNELYYAAGNTTGRSLELTCPWGTQQMANDILQKVSPSNGRAFQYQPYSATNAILDPAAEIGDGVTIKDTYSGIYAQTETFGVRHLSDISAPTEEEVDHEYPYESATNRRTDRRFAQEHAERRAEFKLHQSMIDARVTKVYDSTTEAFGWRLTENQFLVYGGNNVNNPVLKVTKDGLTVRGSGTFSGTITANDGKIGNFVIKNGTLQYGKTSLTDGNNGVYIGSNGIALGKNSAFRVDSAGNLYATSGTFAGTVYAGNIQYGGNKGYFNGSGLADGSVGGGGSGGKIKAGSLSRGDLNSGINSNLDHGQSAWGGIRSAYIGNYKLEFGSGIVIPGSSFYDSTGKRCSGVASRSNVVTARSGGYDW